MEIRSLLLSATLWQFFASTSDAARILGLFPFPSKSHFNSFTNLLETLAKRGHDVTVISAYPRTSPLPNYTDIPIDDYLRQSDDVNYFERRKLNPLDAIYQLTEMMISNCERFLRYPQIQEVLQGDKEFDLIIFELCFSECAYCFMHRFKAPFIQISSNSIGPWAGEGVGNPNFYSYVPELSLKFSDHMSFKERFINLLWGTTTVLLRELFILPRQEAIMRQYYSDPHVPSIREIQSNASFLLLNSHVSINYPRPLTPNTAEVGGMHIKEPKKLPKDLQQYLDDSPHGVIYFSFGSHIRSTQMPESIRKVFLEVFSNLKQNILWKWETDSLPGQPKNVRIGKWLPQNDILAHPNMKLFMTHAGLLSTQEAVYHGTPLVALPVFGDQLFNAHRAERAGYAVTLNLHNVTVESLSWAINEVLENRRYGEKAKQLSKLFRDQPMKPLDQAVFWVEYVIRHKGASHMKSAALSLNIFQYFALDVIAVILVGFALVLAFAIVSCKVACRYLFSKSSTSKYTSESKKKK